MQNLEAAILWVLGIFASIVSGVVIWHVRLIGNLRERLTKVESSATPPKDMHKEFQRLYDALSTRSTEIKALIVRSHDEMQADLDRFRADINRSMTRLEDDIRDAHKRIDDIVDDLKD